MNKFLWCLPLLLGSSYAVNLSELKASDICVSKIYVISQTEDGNSISITNFPNPSFNTFISLGFQDFQNNKQCTNYTVGISTELRYNSRTKIGISITNVAIIDMKSDSERVSIIYNIRKQIDYTVDQDDIENDIEKATKSFIRDWIQAHP